MQLFSRWPPVASSESGPRGIPCAKGAYHSFPVLSSSALSLCPGLPELSQFPHVYQGISSLCGYAMHVFRLGQPLPVSHGIPSLPVLHLQVTSPPWLCHGSRPWVLPWLCSLDSPPTPPHYCDLIIPLIALSNDHMHAHLSSRELLEDRGYAFHPWILL